MRRIAPLPLSLLLPLLTLAVTLTAFALPPRPLAAEPRPLDDAARFVTETDAWMNRAIEEIGVVPGMAIAVVVGDEVVLARGYGTADREAGVSATADTQFYIASTTKSFTGLLAAMADAAGELKLDSPLSAHLDGIRMDPALKSDAVTLRDLLTHTSGIDNGPIGFRVAFSGDHDPATLWNLLASSEPAEDAPLGTYQYTNVGYNIYTLILDRESGTRWQDRMQKHLFTPLGLSRTTAYVSKGKERNWPGAAPYFGLHPDGIQRLTLEKQDNTMQSAGGLMTTANDAARWLEFQINRGRIDGVQIVPESIVRGSQEKLVAASSKSPPFEQTGYGLGWSHATYRDEPVLSHGGGFAGFRSLISFMPESGIGVAVLVNESSIGGQLLGVAALRAYDWWLGHPTVEHDEAVGQFVERLPQFSARMAAEFEKRAAREWQLARPLTDYAGTYRSDLYGTIVIQPAGESLDVRLGNLHCTGTAYTKPETMRVELVPGSGEVFEFQPATGPVERLRYDSVVFERVATGP